MYRHNAFPRTWHQTLMIAVLDHPVAVVSGRAAAALHGFEGCRPCRTEITVPPSGNHRSRLAIVRRTTHIEQTAVEHIPVVTPTQTVFDIAGQVPLPTLFRATEDALVRGALRVDELERRFATLAPLHNHGIGAVRAALDEFGTTGFVPAASELEACLFGVLDDLGIPYERQAAFPWRTPAPMLVDGFMPTLGAIGEADGRRWHSRVADFERDRARDNVAAAHGIHVMRFTHRMLTREVDEVRRLLEMRRRSASAFRSAA